MSIGACLFRSKHGDDLYAKVFFNGWQAMVSFAEFAEDERSDGQFRAVYAISLSVALRFGCFVSLDSSHGRNHHVDLGPVTRSEWLSSVPKPRQWFVRAYATAAIDECDGRGEYEPSESYLRDRIQRRRRERTGQSDSYEHGLHSAAADRSADSADGSNDHIVEPYHRNKGRCWRGYKGPDERYADVEINGRSGVASGGDVAASGVVVERHRREEEPQQSV